MFSNHAAAERHCAKTNIKRTIRSVLGDRIVALCKQTARKLKGEVAVPAILRSSLVLTTSAEQTEIGHFAKREVHEEVAQNETEPEAANDDNSNSSGEEPPQPEEGPRGLIYARVSSGDQLEGEEDAEDRDVGAPGYDEGSIEGQIEELTELAKSEGIRLPYDPITDEAQTGTDFDRDGIQEVFERAKRDDIDFLLVEKVDRIGRNAPETLYFIYILQSECEVTLLTPSGKRDLNEVEGLMQTTLLSLMAEVQNDIRTTKAKKERVRGFLQKKNWKCKMPTVPLGYNETDDGWLEVNPDEKKIVRDMFRKFVDCGVYAETERYIDSKYGTDVLDGHQVDTLLSHSVYIGKPQLPEEWIAETTYENNLEDQSLNLLEEEESAEIDVSEETFEKAQELIKGINEKYSSDDDTHQLLDFIEEFSLFAVVEGSEPATLLHHCGEPLVKDGQRDLRGRTVHRYRCRNCEESEDPKSYYRQWPQQYELDQIKLIHEVVEGDSNSFEGLRQ